MNINYQLEMKRIIDNIPKNTIPTLLLHSCCAPCSSYVLETLSKHFYITIYYYNPNIAPFEEFEIRTNEQIKLIEKMNCENPVSFIKGDYENDIYEEAIKQYRKLGEGSERCYHCYKLRLKKTAALAHKLNFDYFTTTLSISPHKNAKLINEIGKGAEERYKTKYLYADFKKKNGYKRSLELSKEYNLYRQNYCGCIYSKKEV